MKRYSDKERLDWLDKKGDKITSRSRGWVYHPRPEMTGDFEAFGPAIIFKKTLRQILDVAMRQ